MQGLRIEIDRKMIMHYFLIYMCFLNTSSHFSSIKGDGFIVFTMVVSVLLILTNIITLKKTYFIAMGCLFGLIALQHCIIQGDISFNSYMNLLSKFLISYCAVRFDSDEFVDRFVKMTAFLALISVIMYLISLSPLEPLLRILLSQNSETSYGQIFYHYKVDYGRNVGIFREPDVYVLFLNIALYFLLFSTEIKANRGKKIMIVALALATSGSTAGYITALLILFCFVLAMKEQLNSKMVITLLVGIFVLTVFMQTEYFNEHFISKIQFSNGSFESGTGNARLASMLIDIELIRNNFFGTGMTGTWINTSSIATQEVGSSVGLTATVLSYGIPISVVFYSLYLWAFKKISNSNVEFCALILMFISSFLSQPWVLSPSYLMLLSLGFCLDGRIKHCDKMNLSSWRYKFE